MELSTRTEAEFAIIAVEDSRIDAAVAIEFKDAMRAATEGGPSEIILDLSAVDFIDSSGLGAIVATMKMLGTERKLILAALTPTVAKVFKLTRMDTIFMIYETVDEAKQGLAS